MSQKSYIKCLNCGITNIDSDYCIKCDKLINIALSRKLENEEKFQVIFEVEKSRGKIDEFLKNALNHTKGFVRLFYDVLYSIWLFLAVVVGGLISIMIAIAAG